VFVLVKRYSINNYLVFYIHQTIIVPENNERKQTEKRMTKNFITPVQLKLHHGHQTNRIAAVHGSLDRIRQAAPICTQSMAVLLHHVSKM